MAIQTGCWEARAGVVVVVVWLVTRNTILVARWRRLEEHGQIGHGVTRFTLQHIVRTKQIKSTRGRDMIKVRPTPGFCIMTLETGCREA